MERDEHMGTLRENGRKTFRVDADGRVFIGDDAFPYPVKQDSIEVKSLGNRKFHLVTLTILVGDVDMKRRRRRTTTPGEGD